MATDSATHVGLRQHAVDTYRRERRAQAKAATDAWLDEAERLAQRLERLMSEDPWHLDVTVPAGARMLGDPYVEVDGLCLFLFRREAGAYGYAEAAIEWPCARCGEPVRVPVASPYALGAILSGEDEPQHSSLYCPRDYDEDGELKEGVGPPPAPKVPTLAERLEDVVRELVRDELADTREA